MIDLLRPLTCIVSIVAVVAACGSVPNPYLRQHPDLAAKVSTESAVAIVPVTSELSLRSGDYTEPLKEHSARIGIDLGRLLADQLSSRGFSVQTLDASQVYPDEVAHLVSNIKQNLGPPSGTGASEANFSYSLGNDIRPIADVASADLIVLTGFSGWKRSGGSVAAEYAIKMLTMSPGDPTGYGSLLVALVDARSGDVLWANLHQEVSANPNPPDFEESRLQQMLTEALLPLPARSSAMNTTSD